LETLADAVEVRVKAGVYGGVEQGATELLPKVRAELTAGFREAAAEALSAFRDEVRKGFIEALSASDLLDRTAKKVVRTGSSLMESGLNLLRATRPDDRGNGESH
jgi:hypothetical protein